MVSLPSILHGTRRVFAIKQCGDLRDVLLAIYGKNITFVFDAPAQNRGSARRWTNPKAAISRLYRSKSVANAARAFYSTRNHRHRICSMKLADEGFYEKKMPFHFWIIGTRGYVVGSR